MAQASAAELVKLEDWGVVALRGWGGVSDSAVHSGSSSSSSSGRADSVESVPHGGAGGRTAGLEEQRRG